EVLGMTLARARSAASSVMGPECTGRPTPDDCTNTVLGTSMRPDRQRTLPRSSSTTGQGEPELVDEATDVVDGRPRSAESDAWPPSQRLELELRRRLADLRYPRLPRQPRAEENDRDAKPRAASRRHAPFVE